MPEYYTTGPGLTSSAACLQITTSNVAARSEPQATSNNESNSSFTSAVLTSTNDGSNKISLGVVVGAALAGILILIAAALFCFKASRLFKLLHYYTNQEYSQSRAEICNKTRMCKYGCINQISVRYLPWISVHGI